MSDKKIAVFFPGIGYTNDKPLMYYSRKLAEESRRKQKKAEKTGEGRRKREKRFELQRIFGTDQYDAGGHRQVCPDGRGTR